MGSGEEALPVFLFPSSLTFALSDPATHKQILTLYNPYEFPIQYQVLSTAPRKYSVLDPQGILRPKCCIDIHLGVLRSALGASDRFRVTIQERGNRSVGGRKDVPAILIQNPPTTAPESPPFFQGTTATEEVRGSSRSQYAFPPSEIRGSGRSEVGGGVSLMSVVGGLMCVVTLSLPSLGDESSLPEYLRMTLPQKLVAAYVLGLITMLLIRR